MMFFHFTFIAIAFVPQIVFTFISEPIAKTDIGQITGLLVQKSSFVNVFQFLGVPYAQPPIGPLRFQEPKPLTSNSTRQIFAQNFSPSCIQHKHLSQVINPLLNNDEDRETSEDCLYLNIYVPIIDGLESTKLPVMVWLAGEGFDFADAKHFDGSYLASLGKVIVVTVQYRVGVFGFLKDDTVAKGNMGLWDQIQALNFINRNIHAFGGDSKKVTVFGRFTGSMSISHLLASPVLRGESIKSKNLTLPLFNQAILMSGVAVGDWTLDRKASEKSEAMVKSLGCDRNNASVCLLGLNASQILAKAGYGWRPAVDSMLIEDEPMKVLKKGLIAKNVEKVMLGSTESEGLLCLFHWFAFKSKLYNKILKDEITEKDLISMVKKDIKNYKTAAGNHLFENMVRELRSQRRSSLSNRYIKFCSSLLIHSHHEKLAKILSEENNIDTLSYRLKYKPSFSISPDFIKSAAHGDDVLLAFGLPFGEPKKSTKNDLKMSESLVKLFSSFAHDSHSVVVKSTPEIEFSQRINSVNSIESRSSSSSPIFGTFSKTLLNHLSLFAMLWSPKSS